MRSRAIRDPLLLLPWPMPMAGQERRAHPVVGANVFRTIGAHTGVRCSELFLIKCGLAAGEATWRGWCCAGGKPQDGYPVAL
jgi:hypothetical protein